MIATRLLFHWSYNSVTDASDISVNELFALVSDNSLKYVTLGST